MATTSELCIHPDLVEDLVEELLANDIISKEKVMELKSESSNRIDPNVIMDMRHKEIKNPGLLVGIDSDKNNTALKRENAEIPLKTLPKVKDLKVIDKEIAKTRKDLEKFKVQLTKKNESIKSSILTLEKDNELDTSSPLVVNLNEEEAKQYFNLHLDCLEDTIVKKLYKEKEKIWKPYELKQPPVINVVTTLKVVDFNLPSNKFDEEELKVMELCDLMPIAVTGTTLQGPLMESCKKVEEVNNIVPHNSPSLDMTDPPISIPKEVNLVKEERIAKQVIKTWKLHVKTKATQRFVENKKLDNDLLKKVFTAWLLYVRGCKVENKSNSTSESKNKTVRHPTKNLIVANKAQKKKNLELQPKMLNSCIVTRSLNDCVIRHNTDTVSPKKSRDVGTNCTNTVNNAGSKIRIQEVTPEGVGLTDDKEEKTSVCKSTPNKNKQSATGAPLQEIKNQESFAHRYAAQEKIIAQQLVVIEKQKQMITDLKAENLDTKSKLNLMNVENQLVEANLKSKRQPVMRKTAAQSSSTLEKNTKPENGPNDRINALTKNMMARQEHCKELAERTRMRKMRMEEEKAKLLAQQEEKKRLEKEELKNLRIQKMKIDYKNALESAKIAQLAQQNMMKSIEKAKKHYNETLLRKGFKAFSQVSLDKHIKIDECRQFYKKKILKKAFIAWKSEIKESIFIKVQFAEKYYCAKLVERSWNKWRRLHQEYRLKMQVSEDMFALKLQQRMLRRWLAFAAQQFLQTCCKMELADRLYRKHLLKNYFHRWKDFPKQMVIEREKEQRRRAWRQTVQELIPDFSPIFAEKFEV